jgi:uncharacterized protein with FMN-binding domain
MEPQSNRTTPKVITTLAVLVVTVVIVFGAKALSSKKPAAAMTPTASHTTTKSTTTDTTTPSTSTSTSTTAATTTYKDGSYTATGSYDSPGGTEKITVHITVASDAVTTTSAESGAGDPTAQEFQDEFISGYKSLVVGKDLSSIHLSHVSGSSLTSQGFNSAIDKIKSQAKS